MVGRFESGSLFEQGGAQKVKPRPMSVSEVNLRAKHALEQHLGRVWIEGEVSRPKVVSGHTYFTLKDKQAQLASVLFRRDAAKLKCGIESGMRVWAKGKLTVYGPYGRYQLMVESLEPVGEGALQAAYDALKQKLQKEGLFSEEKKRVLPTLPRRVAVVTSDTGAVIQDIFNVAQRRFPNANILVYPSRVQGAESAVPLLATLEMLAKRYILDGIDVAIIARGGGSIEDLWGFNDERVVRAVARCPVPIVSAVGHETDVTLCDFAADIRAPTPSSAAELVFPRRADLQASLQGFLSRSYRALDTNILRRRQRIERVERSLLRSEQLLAEPRQRLVDALTTMERAVRHRIDVGRRALEREERQLARHHPKMKLQALRAEMNRHEARQQVSVQRRLVYERGRFGAVVGKLDALSPLAVLTRGYGIILGQAGEAIKSINDIKKDDTLTLQLGDGRAQVRVENKEASDV